ncbi:hypothetical protein V3C99_005168 [Haemonchus contortus]
MLVFAAIWFFRRGAEVECRTRRVTPMSRSSTQAFARKNPDGEGIAGVSFEILRTTGRCVAFNLLEMFFFLLA